MNPIMFVKSKLRSTTTTAAVVHRFYYRSNGVAALLRRLSTTTATVASATEADTDECLSWSLSKQDPLQKMTPETQTLVRELLVQIHDPDYDAWKHRSAVSRAITLVESKSKPRQEQAALLLTHLLRNHHPKQKDHFRVGIAGSPGAGKSSFIEAFGKFLLNQEANSDSSSSSTTTTTWKPDRLAVVCVDPSSLRSGGSIMGDKTRMAFLASDPRAFVRPAATQGTLGGLAPRTDDVLRLLSQQYPLTIIETVGLGQSEVEAQQSVDMLILAVPPGGGDDLQGVKKGIVEVSDMIIVTKADGDLLSTAKHTAADYKGAMQFLSTVTADELGAGCPLPTKVVLASSVTGFGLDKVWSNIVQFRDHEIATGRLELRRKAQARYWLWKEFQNAVQEQTEHDPALQSAANALYQELDRGILPPRVAATVLLKQLHRRQSN